MAIKQMKTMRRSPFLRVLFCQKPQVPAAKVLLATENLEVLKNPYKMAVKQTMSDLFSLFYIYEINIRKFQAQTWGEHFVYRNCF